MSIKITNNSELAIKACINKWGDEGDTVWFIIQSGTSETWARETDKPLIMLIEKDKQITGYCIYSESKIIITDTKVTDRGLEKNSLY
ncbi:hypothetical protein [Acinetobacter silvestris]|uniref:Uncharacterized protein n=1 Tax=Acinetobacter silvestris TaxID=1977882 RepID=A0A1Y3CIJ2_9GAMM|nr:hypothetical protein [Acinetobacter silvestris]OTG66428.1 hypothetical protein B9T28_04015 [Acinetobacter silvestris]